MKAAFNTDFVDDETLTACDRFFKQLQHAQALVPLILATGVVEGDDQVEGMVRKFGHEALYSDAIRALTQRLEDAVDVPNPERDDPGNVGHLDDAMLARCIDWGWAGYVLGIAVGMRLGPHAFDTKGAKGGA